MNTIIDNATLIQYNQTSPLTMICNALGNIMHPANSQNKDTVHIALGLLKVVVDLQSKPVEVSANFKAMETA